MINQPLVTVGALNYNNSNYVLETLESIKQQSYPNIELLIVDDKSTDNSVELINKWLATYNKPYMFIKHEKNMGVCVACNSVLKNANGKYISAIGTDDIMMTDKIKIQVEILESSANDVCAVYSDAYLINDDSSPRYGWFIQIFKHFDKLPSGYIYDILMTGNFLPAMSLLVKKSCYDEIGFFDEALQYEDYDMWLRLSKKYKFLASDYVSVKYRVRQGSITSQVKDWDVLNSRIYLKHVDHPFAKIKIDQYAYFLYSHSKLSELKEYYLLKEKSILIKKIALFERLKIPRSIGVKHIYKHKTW